MKHIGQITVVCFVSILFLIFRFFGDVLDVGFIDGLFLISVVLGWWIGKRFDKSRSDNVSLQKNIDELASENKCLQKSKEELQQLYESIDMTIFSYDNLTNYFYASKGVKQILGYSNKEFYDDPKLWKKIIHQDDVTIFEKNQQQLYSGIGIEMKHRIITKNNEIRWVQIKATPIQDSLGNVTKINGILLDISVEKKLEEKLKQLAYFDNLTELPNRASLQKHLKKVLARAKRHQYKVTIAFIDLDGFKKVNDKFGHESGDLLLQEVANRLNDIVREEDLIARIGGDEFIIVFEETEKVEVEGVCNRILREISSTFMINDHKLNISPSIGISMFPTDGDDSDTLIKNADRAMYFAKSKGKNNFQYYHPDLIDLPNKKFVFLEKIVSTLKK
ncbi:diguanylate cyclase domain-containing protein [Salipaludibacillus sp. HK11]|uniref:diguanylate cyclase domain-containing protein n=1 Tax=Salipaludibacillus sp. HK11 TaxID=3394320 RepID=UPI0039FC65F3